MRPPKKVTNTHILPVCFFAETCHPHKKYGITSVPIDLIHVFGLLSMVALRSSHGRSLHANYQLVGDTHCFCPVGLICCLPLILNSWCGITGTQIRFAQVLSEKITPVFQFTVRENFKDSNKAKAKLYVFLCNLFNLHSQKCHYNHPWLFSRSFYALKPKLKNNVIVIILCNLSVKTLYLPIAFRLTYVTSKSSSPLE